MARRWVIISLFGFSLSIVVVWFALGNSLLASADASQTTRVSVNSSGEQGNASSGVHYNSASRDNISANGRFVAFQSDANNLVTGDTNNVSDIFVHDRQTGATTRVSISSTGVQANGASEAPAISADGQYVTFTSSAHNLVPNDTNGKWDIFVHDRQTGQTQRVSITSAGTQLVNDSFGSVISGDGRIVAFLYSSSYLDGGGIFTHDRQTGQTTYISWTIDGIGTDQVKDLAISTDGRFVAFSSSDNFVPGEYYGIWDVFVYDRQTDVIEIVSVNSQGGFGNGESTHPALSADGRYVVFHSKAYGLDSSGTNIFVHDRQTGQTNGVDVSSGGANADKTSGYPDISGDGRYIVFHSQAGNLVDDDSATCLSAYNIPESCSDIFIHDRQTGQTERVSIDSAGVQGNGHSILPSISSDSNSVVFVSEATNLVQADTNNEWDVYIHERETDGNPTATATSSPTASTTPPATPTPTSTSIATATPTATNSPTPTRTATATATGLPTATATNPLTLTATPTRTPTATATATMANSGATTRVSVDSSGVQGNNGSMTVSISADGRFVAFTSFASNLISGDTNGYSDIFVHDRQTGATTRVSVDSTGAQGNNVSWYASISADGRFVAFTSYASNLVSGDTNDYSDVFVHDRQTGATTRVSIDSSGAQGNHASSDVPSISADGRFVAFTSFASNLVSGDTNDSSDVFVHDRQTGATTRVSVDSSGA